MGVVMGKMPRYVYCGIDPGKTGGMAFLCHDKSKPPILFPFTNKTPWDIHDFLEEINPSYHLIEKVAGDLRRRRAGPAAAGDRSPLKSLAFLTKPGSRRAGHGCIVAR